MGQPVLGQTGQPIKTGQLYSCRWNRRKVHTDGTAGLGADGTVDPSAAKLYRRHQLEACRGAAAICPVCSMNGCPVCIYRLSRHVLDRPGYSTS